MIKTTVALRLIYCETGTNGVLLVHISWLTEYGTAGHYL